MPHTSEKPEVQSALNALESHPCNNIKLFVPTNGPVAKVVWLSRLDLCSNMTDVFEKFPFL